MSLSTWNLPGLVPTFVDGLQYPAGPHVNEGGWIGEFWTIVPPVEGSGAHQYGAPLEVYRAGWVRRGEAWPANQFAVYQTVVPLDGAPGSSIGVRMGPGDTGYTLSNVSYTDTGEWLFALSRTTASGSVPIAYWNYPGGGNPDGSFIILECKDVDGGVELRASVAASPWGGVGGYTLATEGPHDFPADIEGDPVLLGSVVDTSPLRILSGSPGFGGAFQNAAGGCYGFSAGHVFALTAQADAPSGATVRISGTKWPNALVELYTRETYTLHEEEAEPMPAHTTVETRVAIPTGTTPTRIDPSPAARRLRVRVTNPNASDRIYLATTSARCVAGQCGIADVDFDQWEDIVDSNVPIYAVHQAAGTLYVLLTEYQSP